MRAMDWDEYHRLCANPIIIDRDGRTYKLSEWDFGRHCPKEDVPIAE